MLEVFDERTLAHAGPRRLSDVLERGGIVYLPRCPVALPAADDLERLRQDLPAHMRRKNASYHPESDAVSGVTRSAAIYPVAHRVLSTLRLDIATWARAAMPELMRDAEIGTCSFRPFEEAGRAIDSHRASERVHIDAGAYGATNGNRILRFLINVHPERDRVWASKGNFASVFARHAERAGFSGARGHVGRLDKNAIDRLLSATIGALTAVAPAARMLDTSPYDRAMKRFHDYLKDNPEFQAEAGHHIEMRFAPFSAWMVFADGVSHGCLSGQHCFIWTALVPLANAHFPELAPLNVLRAAS